MPPSDPSPKPTTPDRRRFDAYCPIIDDLARAAAQSMSEKDLLDNVRRLAQLTGWWCYHTHDSRRSEAGFPDLVLAKIVPAGSARLLFVELKSEKGRLTDEQMDWLYILSLTKHPTVVWRPRHWVAGVIEHTLTR